MPHHACRCSPSAQAQPAGRLQPFMASAVSQVIWVATKLYGSKVFDLELLRCTIGKVLRPSAPLFMRASGLDAGQIACQPIVDHAGRHACMHVRSAEC